MLYAWKRKICLCVFFRTCYFSDIPLKKMLKTFLVCHSILWYEKRPLDHFCISFSLVQACAVRWSEFFPFFINVFSWSQVCAVSFPAVNVRHKVSTRNVVSTSIYEELDLVTLKHSYWFLFLFNKTYFHKRWKGDGVKFFSNGENSSWLTHQCWYWDGSMKQNMLLVWH